MTVKALSHLKTSCVWGLLCLAAVALLAIGSSAQPAYAYFNFGTVQVSAGSSDITVEEGGTVSTSISLNPSSDSQTLGCGMAKCPQICESSGAVAAGYTCFDVNGNCTCAGPDYSTYYTTVSASSSDSGVASAYVSGNTLVVSGMSAGDATITLTGELRQWTTGSSTVHVKVTSGSSSGDSSRSGGSSSGSSRSGASTSNTSAATVATPQAATASSTDSSSDQVIQTTAGTVHKVAITSSLNTKDTLAQLSADGDQAIFYSGNADSPDYSWTLTKSTLSTDATLLQFDPTISVSSLGTGMVANLLKQAGDGLVLDFNHSGNLPGQARIDVKVSGTYPDGTTLKLFLYDEDNYKFSADGQEVTVAGGYASFTISHCSTWALSKSDLASYSVSETNTPGARQASEDGATSQGELPIVPIVIGLAVVVVIVVIASAILRKTKKETENPNKADHA